MKNVCALCAVFGLVATAYAQPDKPDRPPHRPDGPPSAKSIFERLDADGDGSLSMKEFEKGHQKMAERMKHGPPPFARPDHDKKVQREHGKKRGSQKGNRSHGKHRKLGSHHNGFRMGPPQHFRHMMARRWSGRFSHFGRSHRFGFMMGRNMMERSGRGHGPKSFHGHHGPRDDHRRPPHRGFDGKREHAPDHRDRGEHMKPEGPRGPRGPEHGERGHGPERKGPPMGERGPGPDRKGPPRGERGPMTNRGEFENRFSQFMDNIEGRRPGPGREIGPRRGNRPDSPRSEQPERSAEQVSDQTSETSKEEPVTSEAADSAADSPADVETPADKA